MQGTRKITVAQPEGLHARPAAQFVQLANRFQSTMNGTEVELDVQGNDAEQAFAELTAFLGSSGGV